MPVGAGAQPVMPLFLFLVKCNQGGGNSDAKATPDSIRLGHQAHFARQGQLRCAGRIFVRTHRQDIKILEILESESNKRKEKDKINRVDIMVATQTGEGGPRKVPERSEDTFWGGNERIIVEVQCDRQVDYLSRILFGACKAVTESIGEGEKYKNIKKVISVTIAYFDIGQGDDDYVYHGTTRFEGIHTHKLLTLSAREEALYHKKTVEDIYPEFYLLRVNSFDHETRNNLDEWV
ncbi:MAG: PD-(D/E)XK nuclease family transposase, partial [Myxococcota bacterium]